MRKRKTSPLGPSRPVRTIPIPITVRDSAEPAPSRPLVPLEPSLASLGARLRPPSIGGTPSAWTSWATAALEDDLLLGRWETPVVDGEALTGGGIGFARPEVATGPIALHAVGPAAAASDAGWAPAPPAPAPGSWVRPVAQLGTVAADPPDTAGAPDLAVAGALALPASPAASLPGTALPEELAHLPEAVAQHPSMAAHPSMAVQPPAPPRAPGVDPEDFTQRLARGTAYATTEQQLLTLADRALGRLAPHGRARWFVRHPDDTLTLRHGTGDGAFAGCAVAECGSCPAISSGRARRFERSDDLDACPQLLAVPGPQSAVVCVPVHGGGPLRGVLQVGVPADAPLDLVTAALVDRTARALADRMTELRAAGGDPPA